MTAHTESSPQHLLLDTAPQAFLLPRLLQAYRLHLFYGDLHNHTGYSDGIGRPEDALRQMRARGLHFAAITDHGELLDQPTSVPDAHKWAAAARQVAACSAEDFVAMRGFEWSSPRQGHSHVWCSADFTSYQATGDATMAAFYEWLAKAEPTTGAHVLAGFNHPGREIACFDGFAYTPAMDAKIVTLECFNRPGEPDPSPTERNCSSGHAEPGRLFSRPWPARTHVELAGHDGFRPEPDLAPTRPVTEAVRTLNREGLLWVDERKVSQQAVGHSG